MRIIGYFLGFNTEHKERTRLQAADVIEFNPKQRIFRFHREGKEIYANGLSTQMAGLPITVDLTEEEFEAACILTATGAGLRASFDQPFTCILIAWN